MRKPGQFRDMTALEVLRDGEREAMEGLGGAALAMAQVAGSIDARFAAIEARLKALEDVARLGVAMPSGAGRGEAGLCDAPHGEDIEK
jgi:D-arabinose 1-dehydrogenase-like Zn-dependent alcohol dehydrogenase